MSTALQVAKGTALAKTSRPVKELMKRVERARQRYNERHARAEADLMAEIRAAVLGEAEAITAAAVSNDTPEASADAAS
jgi:hypothetical protein